MKKIAHIQLLPLLSGAQRVTLDELQRLSDYEYEKYLICNDEGPLTLEARKSGIHVIIVKSLKRNISPYFDIVSLIKLIKIIKKEKFDIVHTHSSKTGVLGRLAAFYSKTPLIIHTVHGFSFPSAKNKLQLFIYYIMEKLGTVCGDALICLHDEDKRIAVNKLKLSPDKIHMLPNGVDINKFKPLSSIQKEEIRESIGLKNSDTIIGMTGRLWEQKNPLFLFDNLVDILLSNKNIKLVFMGDGELSNSLKERINTHKLSSQVFLLGWCNNTEEILNALDIFVLPSKWEGMPLAILEAQSTGLPCVVSNINGNKILVTNFKDGFLFDLDDIESFHDSITRLLYDRDLRENLGDYARNKIVSSYSINERIKKIDLIYKNLLL
ncbi:TPA: glycosyltransferase family 4 protein [Providencia alcalifaciens]